MTASGLLISCAAALASSPPRGALPLHARRRGALAVGDVDDDASSMSPLDSIAAHVHRATAMGCRRAAATASRRAEALTTRCGKTMSAYEARSTARSSRRSARTSSRVRYRGAHQSLVAVERTAASVVRKMPARLRSKSSRLAPFSRLGATAAPPAPPRTTDALSDRHRGCATKLPSAHCSSSPRASGVRRRSASTRAAGPAP